MNRRFKIIYYYDEMEWRGIYYRNTTMVSRQWQGIAVARHTRCLRHLAVGNHTAADAHRTGPPLLGAVHGAVAHG